MNVAAEGHRMKIMMLVRNVASFRRFRNKSSRFLWGKHARALCSPREIAPGGVSELKPTIGT